MVQGSKGRIAFVAVDLEQDPMCDLLNSYATYKKDRDPDLRRPIGIELVVFQGERRWFLFCERCRARAFAWHVPATNLPTSGTRRPGEYAEFKSLDTGLPKRLVYAIELRWGLEAHTHPDNQLSARGLEPRECGNDWHVDLATGRLRRMPLHPVPLCLEPVGRLMLSPVPLCLGTRGRGCK